MADNLITPVADGNTLAFKDLASVFYALNMIVDQAGADAIGLVTGSPNAQSILGRLKTIGDGITTMSGYVDGLETLNGLLNGYVDGLETLIGATNTALAAATPAGENYIGKTGGDVYSVSATPTVSATPDYATGEAIGGIMTFANAVRTSGGSGIIQGANIFSKVANTTQIDLLLFNANPSATTVTDNAAFDLNSADFSKLIAAIPFTEWIAAGTPCIGQSVGRGQPIKPATGTSIYGVLVARGAVNLGGTGDITTTLNIIPG